MTGLLNSMQSNQPKYLDVIVSYHNALKFEQVQFTYLVCLSLLTMTNPNQLCDVLLFVCSKMADETNFSSKLPVVDRTREV